MKTSWFVSVCVIGLLSAQQVTAQQDYQADWLRSVGYAGEAAATAQVDPAGECSTCDTGDSDCQTCESGCGLGTLCVDPCYQPRFTFFGDVLQLRARDVQVPFAVPIDGPIGTPVVAQAGRVADVDADYEHGFRIGGTFQLDCDAAIGAMYTYYRTDNEAAVATDAPLVLRSLVSAPVIANADSDGLEAFANYDIEYQIVDVDYRGLIACNGRSSLTWLAGVSYVHLEESFTSSFGVNGVNAVASDIGFDGGGIRLGLEFERYARDCGLLVYGRSSARFVAGSFDADYIQSETPGDRVQVYTGIDDDRILSILDLELGLGWQSCDGCFRTSLGYMVSGWFNTLTTTDWIAGVHGNNYNDMSDTITFDGFVGRVELRY